MDELIKALEASRNLGNISFGSLLVFILFASYKGWWMWGRQLAENNALWSSRLEAERIDKNEWKRIALEAHGIAEFGLSVVKSQKTVRTE